MRVGFAGTPAFAAFALAALQDHGFTIPVVLTQPDRPFGRGLQKSGSPVKACAVELGLPVLQPPSLKPEGVREALYAIPVDVLVVAAYGLILPQAVLDWPRHGGLNIHASLLPRWRGAAPIARAIEAGDATTGITIMQMDAGLDTGPIVTARTLAIGPHDTTGSLTGRLAVTPQPGDGVTYAAKITRADALVDWTQDADMLDRRIRALAPSPGAVAGWRGRPVKIRAAIPTGTRAAGASGTVAAIGAQGVDVVCGSGSVLRLAQLQPAAGRSMPAQAFAAGHRVVAGERFEPGR
jgi:methionyl-tRNA formyltransferase